MLIERKTCLQNLKLERSYSYTKDSIGISYRNLTERMDRNDSLTQDVVVQFKGLLDMKDKKYDDMKGSLKEYNNELISQNKKTKGTIGGLLGATLLGILLAIFLHK